MRVAVSEQDQPLPTLAGDYSPEIIAASDAFAQAVYRHSILPLRMFEAARVATAVINGCTVCMAWRTARDAAAMGLIDRALAGPEPDEAFYQTLLAGRMDGLDAREQAAVRFAQAMGTDPRGLAANEAQWAEIKGALTDAEIVDLSYCVAAWMGLGRVAHVLGIDAACTIPALKAAE